MNKVYNAVQLSVFDNIFVRKLTIQLLLWTHVNITWVYLQCVTNLGSKHCFCERCWWISNVSGRVVSADNSLHSVYNCRQAAAQTLVSGQWSPVAGTRRQWSSFPAQSQSHTSTCRVDTSRYLSRFLSTFR